VLGKHQVAQNETTAVERGMRQDRRGVFGGGNPQPVYFQTPPDSRTHDLFVIHDQDVPPHRLEARRLSF
jgi:hypothetical protein